jgi:hypothetical protein
VVSNMTCAISTRQAVSVNPPRASSSLRASIIRASDREGDGPVSRSRDQILQMIPDHLFDTLSGLAPLLRVRRELRVLCRFGAQWKCDQTMAHEISGFHAILHARHGISERVCAALNGLPFLVAHVRFEDLHDACAPDNARHRKRDTILRVE